MKCFSTYNVFLEGTCCSSTNSFNIMSTRSPLSVQTASNANYGLEQNRALCQDITSHSITTALRRGTTDDNLHCFIEEIRIENRLNLIYNHQRIQFNENKNIIITLVSGLQASKYLTFHLINPNIIPVSIVRNILQAIYVRTCQSSFLKNTANSLSYINRQQTDASSDCWECWQGDDTCYILR